MINVFVSFFFLLDWEKKFNQNEIYFQTINNNKNTQKCLEIVLYLSSVWN